MDSLGQWLAQPLVAQLATAVAGLIIVVIAVKIMHRALVRYIEDAGTRYRVRKLLTLGGYLMAALLLSLIFRDRLGNLTVFLGVASAGIAIALQEVILSVAGWLTVSVGGLFKAGDRIQLGGVKGDVIDVAILRTTLMEIGEWVHADQYTGRVVRIANRFVFKEPVYNFSGDFPFLWDELMMPIRHGSDHNLAREIIIKVVDEVVEEYTDQAQRSWRRMLSRYRIERAMIEPSVTLIVTDNWLEYTVRYIVDYKKRRDIKDKIFTRILDEVLKTGGRVVVASATQEIVAFPDLNINLKDKPDGATRSE